MLQDQVERQQAIDPTRSFIVQAPAGSGKTEILTQRFLRLLAHVQAPEQIVALTFTRKAANEMRERILLALQKAAANEKPATPHQQTTYELANQALMRNQLLNWQLLEQPSRLRIFTIDSLCQRLIHAMPLKEKHPSYAQISTYPKSHYLQAARACIDYAAQDAIYHPSLQVLLAHLDNQQARLLTLFSELLANRDQWLSIIHQAQALDKSQFEQALYWIEQHELTRLSQSLPREDAEELTALVQQLAGLETQSGTPRQTLRHLISFSALDRETAASLSDTLLTSQGTLRKAFDHRIGLRKGACNDAMYQRLKTGSKSLLENLSKSEDFIEALQRVKNLPSPYYANQQWEVLQALLSLLPLLAAHLALIFNEQNEVDFTEVALLALQTLGDESSPTDLALYLDHQIHHLLVDEFQDTSIQQFHLLSQLIAGWLPDEGKTLFIVGDPMQSIYRFRAAEVGLFLRAQQHGIGPVHLIPLELKCNFRSTNTLVSWVNQHFRAIFPKEDDIESGAIHYHPSEAAQLKNDESFIKALQLKDRKEEAKHLVDLVAAELQGHPQDNIAILVRSRNELKDIMEQLRAAQIPVQGVDIDLLANLPHLRDVWTLTQVLLMPANRLAWLSLLRSPWCGLTLTDCHRIANFSKRESIFYALGHLDKINDLTTDGRQRAQFLYQVLQKALRHRFQQSLAEWINHTLEELHIHSVLTDAERDELEQFWQLIEQFEHNGQIKDWEQFENQFKKLYSQKVVPSRLQIMTIHKSKGLEFDCVILPGLSSRSLSSDKPLLRWLKLPTECDELLLVSPIKARENEQCLVYDYLERLDNQKNHYEMQRLLYVAATRARKRLYLLDYQEKTSRGSFRHLLKKVLFETPAVEQETEPAAIDGLNAANELPKLFRLPSLFYQPQAINQDKNTESLHFQPPFERIHPSSRITGIVAHELLQWICSHHPQTFKDVPWKLVYNSFRSFGLDENIIQTLEPVLFKQIQTLFDTAIGQWLIKAHTDERNEYELLITKNNEVSTRIIDRTFLENGVRWIIDFKTGNDDEKAISQHRMQVNEYASLLSERFNNPIHCGLYYLSSGKWESWTWIL